MQPGYAGAGAVDHVISLSRFTPLLDLWHSCQTRSRIKQKARSVIITEYNTLENCPTATKSAESPGVSSNLVSVTETNRTKVTELLSRANEYSFLYMNGPNNDEVSTFSIVLYQLAADDFWQRATHRFGIIPVAGGSSRSYSFMKEPIGIGFLSQMFSITNTLHMALLLYVIKFTFFLYPTLICDRYNFALRSGRQEIVWQRS